MKKLLGVFGAFFGLMLIPIAASAGYSGATAWAGNYDGYASAYSYSGNYGHSYYNYNQPYYDGYSNYNHGYNYGIMYGKNNYRCMGMNKKCISYTPSCYKPRPNGGYDHSVCPQKQKYNYSNYFSDWKQSYNDWKQNYNDWKKSYYDWKDKYGHTGYYKNQINQYDGYINKYDNYDGYHTYNPPLYDSANNMTNYNYGTMYNYQYSY